MLQSAPPFLDFSLTQAALVSHIQAWVQVRAHAHIIQNENVSCESFYLREKMMGVDMWLMLVVLLKTLVGGTKILLR